MSKPLVVYATKRAVEEAQRFGLPGVLENVVERAIAEGRVFRALPGGERLVDVGGGVVARVKTGDRAPSGARRLMVERLERAGNYTRRRSA